VSTIKANQAARAVRPPAPAHGKAGPSRPGRRAPAGGPRAWLRRPAGLAATLAATVLLAAACGGGSPGAAASPGRLYRQALTYSHCMRAHGVPDFPDPKPGPGGTLVYPLNPPAGMLTSPGYDAAFRACLKLAVTGGRSAARYRAIALKGLQQAECMRGHGVTGYPSPATLNGGIHSPDYTTLGLDTHTRQFQAAGRACGLKNLWQMQWWWPAGSVQP
jgi:hypothetical protein